MSGDIVIEQMDEVGVEWQVNRHGALYCILLLLYYCKHDDEAPQTSRK